MQGSLWGRGAEAECSGSLPVLSKWHWTFQGVQTVSSSVSAVQNATNQLIIDCSEELAMSAIAKEWKNDNLNR